MRESRIESMEINLIRTRGKGHHRYNILESDITTESQGRTKRKDESSVVGNRGEKEERRSIASMDREPEKG